MKLVKKIFGTSGTESLIQLLCNWFCSLTSEEDFGYQQYHKSETTLFKRLLNGTSG